MVLKYKQMFIKYKQQIICTAIVLLASLLLVAAVSSGAKKDQSPLTSGIYYSQGKGLAGDIWFRVCISNDIIMSIEPIEQNETDESSLTALDAMTQKIIAFNSPYVNFSEGSSVVSQSVKTAVISCINQAKGTETIIKYVPSKNNTDPIPLDYMYNPGQYYGFSNLENGEGFLAPVEVLVDFNELEITNVKIYDNGDDEMPQVKEILPAEIIKWQTYNVDAVSGATDTSKGVIAAVKNCVEQARK